MAGLLGLAALAACGSQQGAGSATAAGGPSSMSTAMSTATSTGAPTTRSSGSPTAPGPSPSWPGGVRPATAATLVGTWHAVRPVDAAQLATTVTLTVEPGGRWTSSDGCRQRSGTWTLGPDGALSVSSTGAVATGCVTDGVSGGIGPWTTAARAGFDGHALVLLTADLRELGRLVQQPPSHLMSHGPAPHR